MRALDVATKFENLKITSETMAGVLSRFSFATAAEKQLKRKRCEKHCFLVVGLEKVVFREENCQGNRKIRTNPVQTQNKPNTLLERPNAEIKNKHG